ncbi:MAG: histidinol-phosphate transaminase [Mycobacteriaceae bacterium]|nr:histidinol-phosphate transaminase [Mycobacteriaceae bacterium]
MTPRLRSDLSAIPAYVPGRNDPDAIKLASNEVTFGPLPAALEAIAAAAALANRYPDNRSSELADAIAKSLRVDPGRVLVGCGSVALCHDIVQIACDAPSDEVAMAWRSFETYPIATRIAGATPVQVPLTADHVHDLAALTAAITDNTRVVFVCNPNNPTGTALGRGALERFLDAVPASVLVVLDEAYSEYLRVASDDFPDGVELGRTRPNVVVLRTFSKAYGLAGLRVGYAVGDPSVISALSQVHVPFSVSRVAQAAALASLRARDELLARTDSLVAERGRVRSALLAAGYAVPPSQTNFVWLPLGERSAAYATASADAGVLIRAYGADGVRITIGEPRENDAFLAFATAPATAAAFTDRG